MQSDYRTFYKKRFDDVKVGDKFKAGGFSWKVISINEKDGWVRGLKMREKKGYRPTKKSFRIDDCLFIKHVSLVQNGGATIKELTSD